MELQFSISELSSYLDEVFPQVVNQYKILKLEPGYAKIGQNVPSKNLRPGGTVFGPTIFSLVDIGIYIFCFWLTRQRSVGCYHKLLY